MNKLSMIALAGTVLLSGQTLAKTSLSTSEPNLAQYSYASLKPSACADSMSMFTLKEMYLILFNSDYVERAENKNFQKCLRIFANKAEKVKMSSSDKNELVKSLKYINKNLLKDDTTGDKVLLSGINKILALIARYVADGMPTHHKQVEKYVTEINSNEGRLMRKVHVEEAIELFRTLFVLQDGDKVVLKDAHNLQQAYQAWNSATQQVGRELGHAFHTGRSYKVPSKQ
ncbi:MAG: hypothetical protein CMM87_04510 [Rickettsiales bacterium]|nr:hypothetical protein [Rickettsiales bacterium]|tara:strand:- start:13369 stop:14055 length:687 start_codon:yes stop_codon:yes gene_type:complete